MEMPAIYMLRFVSFVVYISEDNDREVACHDLYILSGKDNPIIYKTVDILLWQQIVIGGIYVCS
jgi:hypothetical protein